MIGLLLITLFTFLFYLFFKNKYYYWEKRNIPYVKPLPLVGNYGSYILLREFVGRVPQKICHQYPDTPYIGAFYGNSPTLILQDPEVIKLIMTKDFFYFNSRENSKYGDKETFLRSCFFTIGDSWKVVRQNTTPTFSSSKLKSMFQLILTCVYSFESTIQKEIAQDNIVDVRSLVIRYSMDTLGLCIFGININALNKDWENNSFKHISEMFFDSSNKRGIRAIGRSVYPFIFYSLGLRNFPYEIDIFFQNYLTQLFNGNQSISSNGFTELLKKMKSGTLTGDKFENIKGDEKKVKVDIDDKLLLAQCFTMFGAGFDSSALVVAYTLYEMAKNLKTQERAIQEVDDFMIRHNNKLVMDCLLELHYVEACVQEAMRLYPLVSVLRREVMKPYTLPCGAVLDKGVRVHIPAYHLHHNTKYFPNAEEFKPERFLSENKHTSNINPYTYLPFGEGPRNCPGMRFARMQMMPALITILKQYRVELPEDMPHSLDFKPTTLTTQPIKNITLKFLLREDWQQRVYAR